MSDNSWKFGYNDPLGKIITVKVDGKVEYLQLQSLSPLNKVVPCHGCVFAEEGIYREQKSTVVRGNLSLPGEDDAYCGLAACMESERPDHTRVIFVRME